MTKPRHPLTYDNALAKIAGLIGWKAMADTVGQAERTIRDWGDPDIERGCPIEAAEMLDLAYQRAGGDDAPMLDTFSARLDRLRATSFADQVAIARGTCVLSREGGQAIEALILLTLPGATPAQRVNAVRELEEFLSAGRAMLPLIAHSLPVIDTS